MLLFTGGLLATFGSTYIDMAGAGPLGCLVLPFVSGIRWRKINTPEQTVCIVGLSVFYNKGITNYSVLESTDLFQNPPFFAQAAMTEAVGLLWMIFQPFLFGLIGAAVRIEQIQDPYIVGKIWGCQMIQGLSKSTDLAPMTYQLVV